jgi:hypothetical protein
MSDEILGIVPIQQRELTPQVWQMISQMAPVMWKSRLFGVVSQEAAAAIMLKGYELGLSVTASFEFIHVIQGKPGLSPRGALATTGDGIGPCCISLPVSSKCLILPRCALTRRPTPW